MSKEELELKWSMCRTMIQQFRNNYIDYVHFEVSIKFYFYWN